MIAAVMGVLEAAVCLPFALLEDPPAAPLLALAILIAVVAAILGGLIPGLFAAAVGLLCFAFIADGGASLALAVPLAVAAVLAVGLIVELLLHREAERDRALNQLAAIGEITSAGALSIDRDGAITGWSGGAERLFGLDEEQLAESAISDLLRDESPEAVASLLEELQRGQTVRRAFVHDSPDGEEVHATLAISPVYDAENEVSGGVVVAIDERDLLRAEEEAREAETKYGALVRLLPLVVYVCAPQDRASPLYVSPAIETLLGYSPAEWLADGGLSERLMHPQDRERVAESLADAARTESPFAGEYRMLTRDGQVVWVHDESVTVRDENGAALYILGYLRDVTPAKQEEEERSRFFRAEQAAIARAAEERERLKLVQNITELLGATLEYDAALKEVAELLVERMADWCIVDVADEAGTLTRRVVVHAEPRDSNHAAETAPSSEPDVVARRVVRERRPELRPESTIAAPGELPVISEIDVESYVCVPLLSRRHSLGALTLISTPGRRKFGPDDLALAQDVARRAALAIDNARLYREVEERSDAARVLTHVADGVFLLDRGGNFRLLNPAAEAMTGFDSSVIGRPASEVIKGWEVIAERIPIVTSGEQPQEETVPFETEKGERWFSIAGVDFFGGTVYAFRDVTEARRLDELKAEFVATASHELRTPLAAVYGAAQTLRRHDFALDEAGRERFISLITDESERLSRIVNDILLANQLDAGRLELETEPFDSGELVERVVEAARTHAPPGATLEVSVPDDPPAVAADRDKARQVLVNLVENAIKYSPDGGRVVAGVEQLDSSVRFYVSDEGMGIPEEELERIFDKFYRLDPEMTGGIGGTGLGLYICAELVRRMDGRIWASSSKGKGSEFSFELPLAERGTQRATPATARPETAR
jgi:PAS domain S-box-containing protein